MKKKIIPVIFLIGILLMAAPFKAFLGTYEPGDNVIFVFVCLQDGGYADIDCVNGQAELLAPSNQGDVQIVTIPDDAVTELGGVGSFPGAWKVNFTIPQLSTSIHAGTWNLYVNITNVNGTKGATIESFQVVFENQGINSTGANVITALSNQALLKDNIKTVNQTVKDINQSIQENASKFPSADITGVLAAIRTTNATIKEVNQSILSNISQSAFSSSVSGADQRAIGKECAKQSLGANATIEFTFNMSSFYIQRARYNYEALGVAFNETYSYNNISMLNLTNRTVT